MSIETFLSTFAWPWGTLEWVAVLFNLLYVFLASREKIWAWPAGIVGSALSVFLFIHARLYAESALYVGYVLLGFYGWWAWSTRQGETVHITRWSLFQHLQAIAASAVLIAPVGLLLQKTDAAFPWLDATTTGLSLVATVLTARKVLHSWTWWIAIDLVTTWMYASRGLPVYATQMVVYTIMAVIGLVSWIRLDRAQKGDSGVSA